MKTRYLSLALFLVAASAWAGVYKWVDADGKTHYGDQPPSEVKAETVELPKAPPPASTPGTPTRSTADGEGEPPFAGYTRIAIAEPKQNDTVRSNEEQVRVVVETDPGLRQGHKLLVYLDLHRIGEPTGDTRLILDGVHRGRHGLKVAVVDDRGVALGESGTVYFTLRKAAVEPIAPEPSDDKGDPYASDKRQSRDYRPEKRQAQDYKPQTRQAADYKPDRNQAKDYKPDASGKPPYQPGTTAPGYAPNYTPSAP